MNEDLTQTLKALKHVRLKSAGVPETVIHDAIKEALSRENLVFQHQPKIGPRSVPDFFTAAGVVIEVKKGRPPLDKTLKQLTRYANLPAVTALILVTERGLPILPQEINGKPLKQVTTYSAWGIAV